MNEITPSRIQPASDRFLGAAATALGAGTGIAQTSDSIRRVMQITLPISGTGQSASAEENQNSTTPPYTDRGDVAPFWYSF